MKVFASLWYHPEHNELITFSVSSEFYGHSCGSWFELPKKIHSFISLANNGWIYIGEFE